MDSKFLRVLIGSRNPWIFTVLRMERKMVLRFAKVSEEEMVAIKTAFFYPIDLVNTKTTTGIPLRVGEERWIIP